MTKLKINTEKLKDITANISKNISSFEEDVNNLYNEINNLESSWKGPDATTFLKITNNQKKDIDNMIIILNQYTKTLNSIASNIEENM